jgi:rSAM/selenodomain-associated transferase 1
MSTAVLVFTKAPQPGVSKTRLIPALGADEAAAAHEMLALRTLDMTRDLGVAGEDHQVSLWGAAPHPALDLWSDQFALPLHLQAAGDLGQKMLHGFASALDAGADQAVLIGSDCPAMTAEYIRQACAALRASDLVLGPAEDGGYVLIGCKQVYAELFANIPWGSDKVLARTLEQAEQLELSVTLLATLWDVDRPEDWARFQRMTIDSVGSG